ncbi:MAG: hypothetical protein AABZ60_14330 [Planctomycetota bacterium]
MLKLNVIAFIIVSIFFSFWFSSSRSFFSTETLLQTQKLASSELQESSSKEEILEDEIRRLKKSIKLIQNDVKNLNQDILRMDKKYLELCDLCENQVTEFTAFKVKTDRILRDLEKTGSLGKEEAPINTASGPYVQDKVSANPNVIRGPYVQDKVSANPNALSSVQPQITNQPIPFNLILNVPSITEEQKTQYRNMFIEHNRQRNELIRNRDTTVSQEELMKKLEDFRISYEPKFQSILKGQQLSEYEKVVENYKIQREQNQKIRDERKNMRPNQPNLNDQNEK